MFIAWWVTHIAWLSAYDGPLDRPRHDNASLTFTVPTSYYYHELLMTELGSRIKLLFSVSRKPPITGWLYLLIPAIPHLSPSWPRVLAINVSLLFIAFGLQMSNWRRRPVVGTSRYENDVAVIFIVSKTICSYYYIWSKSKIALFIILFRIKPTNYLSILFFLLL